MTEQQPIPNNFHSVIPIGERFHVRQHDRKQQMTIFVTKSFKSELEADAYIEKQERNVA